MNSNRKLFTPGLIAAGLAVLAASFILLSTYPPTVQAAGESPQVNTAIYLPYITKDYVPLPVLQNADLDQGRVAWTEASTNSHVLIRPGGAGGMPTAHSGSYVAWLGGINDETSDLSQQITIPTGTGPFYLHFYYQIASFETNCSQVTPSDAIYLYVNDAYADGIVMCNAFSTGGNWVPFSFVYDLSANAGQTVTLHVKVTTDAALATSVWFDTFFFSSTP